MLNKDQKCRIAYETIIFLLMMALLCYLTRIWIILFFVLIGVLIAALRFLFLSVKKVEVIEPKEDTPAMTEKPDNEQDIIIRAYSIVQRRITESVQIQFPQAKWVWENPNALKSIEKQEPVYILLSGAGGYRKALVQISNLQFCGLKYGSIPYEVPEEPDDSPDKPDEEEPDKPTPEPEEGKEDHPVNYEYLAFEWVEAHLLPLNNRANEAVAGGENTLIVASDELPDEAAWQDICAELIRNGFAQAMVVDSGIQVNLKLKKQKGNENE